LLHEDHHFINSYFVSREAFKMFNEIGNIGNSPKERAQNIKEILKNLNASKKRINNCTLAL